MTDWTSPEDVPATTVESLHRWLNEGNPEDAATSGERAVADVIRAFWPAPAPTLAEEMRAWAGKHYTGVVGTGKHELLNLADRAEQIEQERDEARAEAKTWREQDVNDCEMFMEELAEAHDEVERLTAERDGAREEIAWLRNGPGHTEVATDLPDPADVKPEEAWIVECRGERRTAVKDSDDDEPWYTFTADGLFFLEENENITLITRLAPAPRVITDPDELDKLPIMTVVLAGQESFQRGAPTIGFDGEHSDDWYAHGDTAGFTSAEVLAHGPVTVLCEPHG